MQARCITMTKDIERVITSIVGTGEASLLGSLLNAIARDQMEAEPRTTTRALSAVGGESIRDVIETRKFPKVFD